MFQFGGLGAMFGGLSPPKTPRGDGTAGLPWYRQRKARKKPS